MKYIFVLPSEDKRSHVSVTVDGGKIKEGNLKTLPEAYTTLEKVLGANMAKRCSFQGCSGTKDEVENYSQNSTKLFKLKDFHPYILG